MAPQPLVLASSSRWRLALLREAGLPCEAVPPPVDEESIDAPTPAGLATARARAKAQAVSALRPDALVLGADQVAWLGDEAFGKPRDPDDWMRRLRQLRGRRHTLTTGVCLAASDGMEEFSVESHVWLRADCTDDELLAYVTLGEAAGCAGGYMVERRGAWLVDRIDGDWTNVVGLPIFDVVARLRARGWRLTDLVEGAA